MYKNIFFVGGIHGTGKGTFCSNLALKLNIQHLIASDILRWDEVSPDKNSKLVANLPKTQGRLIQGLQMLIKPDQFYLLDGHYCLLDSSIEIQRISINTFKEIAPVAVAVVVGDPYEIKDRLEKRDNNNYDVGLLSDMQAEELDYAKEIADLHNTSLYILGGENSEDFEVELKRKIRADESPS